MLKIHKVIIITLVPYEIVIIVERWKIFLIPSTFFFILLIIIFGGVIIIVRYGCNIFFNGWS